eukprot:m.248620 g.248620  ORF g.248620 m.248620 type:complete len:251 (+) comp15775_c0_seq1:155-907(+)
MHNLNFQFPTVISKAEDLRVFTTSSFVPVSVRRHIVAAMSDMQRRLDALQGDNVKLSERAHNLQSDLQDKAARIDALLGENARLHERVHTLEEMIKRVEPMESELAFLRAQLTRSSSSGYESDRILQGQNLAALSVSDEDLHITSTTPAAATTTVASEQPKAPLQSQPPNLNRDAFLVDLQNGSFHPPLRPDEVVLYHKGKLVERGELSVLADLAYKLSRDTGEEGYDILMDNRSTSNAQNGHHGAMTSF